MTSARPAQVLEEIQKQEFGRIFGQLAGGRVLALPLFAVFFGAILWLEPVGWRTPLLVLVAIVVSVFFVWELWVYRRKGLDPRAVFRNLVGAVLAILSVVFLTGGLGSPAIYPMIVIAFVTGLMLPAHLTVGLAALQLASFSLLAYLGASEIIADLNLSVFGGGARVSRGPSYLYVHATVLSLSVVLSGQIGRVLRHAFEATLRRTVAAQQESLDAHTERIRELTALSAEIAHELKNPLASVKGLSALLAQSITDGKQAERLEVLRQEVARMQTVLEEFLNFSRPLVPLAVVDTNAAVVCQEVAMLHEGLARERNVTIDVTPGPLYLQCDPRKLKQILINLVQNALDASPAGRTVTIEATEAVPIPDGRPPSDACPPPDRRPTREGPTVLSIRVLDEGAGVDASLGDVFQPGTTSKAAGSGLGLTIARALARQHGGDLVLAGRDGGGTVAEVTLPRVPRLPQDRSEAA